MDLDFGGGDGEVSAQDQDGHHPLPPMDLWGGGEAVHEDEVLADDDGDPPPRPEDSADLQDPHDPLQEEAPPTPGPDGAAEAASRGADNVWNRLVEETKNVGVRNLTFVEVLGSRNVRDVLPAIARIQPHSCPSTSTGLTAAEDPL